MQQVKYHRPRKGEFGDCLRACLASLLDMEMEDVPAFAEGMTYSSVPNMRVYLGRVREWLDGTGRAMWVIVLPVAKRDDVLGMIGNLNPNQRWVLVGGSRATGINHAVCCRGDVIEHDPSELTGPNIRGPLWPDRKVFGAIFFGERR